MRVQQADVLVVVELKPAGQSVKGLQVHWWRGRGRGRWQWRGFQVRYCFEQMKTCEDLIAT